MTEDNLIDQIYLSSKDQETVLFRITRYIEENNELGGQQNYWDSSLDSIDPNERIFYRNWHWLNYLELEAARLIKPPEEFKKIYGSEKENNILRLLNTEDDEAENELLKLRLSGPYGQVLLNWAKQNIK